MRQIVPLRLWVALAVLIAISTALWRPSASSQPPAEHRLPAPAELPRLQLQGASSCSSASCHHADPGPEIRGREYGLALERGTLGAKDRHAQAYAVLFEPRSLRIEQRLRHLASIEQAHPETNVLCLRCHVMPGVEQRSMAVVEGVRQFRLEDGVGCEACHGPAQNWLADHFRPGWLSLSSHQKESLGWVQTASLPGRIRLCVDCHVGAPGMDVNHDLLAAGHPRLNFEFSSFHFLWHKHWDYKRDVDPQLDPRGRPDFEARGWALGQLTAAQAALELLAHRAEQAARRSGPWPELAEHDCFACHHDLKAQSPRQMRGSAFPWNTWYYAQLGSALWATDGRAVTAIDLLGNIRREMEQTRPDAAKVRADALRLGQFIGVLLARAEKAQTPIPIDGTVAHIAAQVPEVRPASWDEAAQAYLGLSAMARSAQALGRPLAAPALTPMRERLRFPDRYDSPRDFDPVRFRAQLETIRKNSSP